MFSEHGESMETYFREAVEPSNLYLDNEYIAFQQALCMVSEMRAQESDTMSLPTQCAWPALGSGKRSVTPTGGAQTPGRRPPEVLPGGASPGLRAEELRRRETDHL